MANIQYTQYQDYINLQDMSASSNAEPTAEGAIYFGTSSFNFNSDVKLASGKSFVIGSADMDETDLEKLDGITNGTVAANKAVVVDGNKDASSFRHLTAAGAITAGTSFIIGSADLNETDMEKLDGITNGTVAANKAVVVDASKDADGFRNITMSGELDGVSATLSGDMTAATITMTGFTVDADGDVASKSLRVDDSSTIGCDSDTDLMTLTSGVLTVAGTVSATIVSGSGTSTIHKVTSDVLSGSSATIHDLVGDSAEFGGTVTAAVISGSGTSTIHKLTADHIAVNTLDVNTINSITTTNQTLEVSDYKVVSALSASSANADMGGFQIGGGADDDGHGGMFWHHSSLQLELMSGSTGCLLLGASKIEPGSDNAFDLGSSTKEWKDLYLDGVAYMDAVEADTLKVGDLTNGRLVLAGASGELEDSTNLSYDGSTFDIAATVSIDGDVVIDRNVTLGNATSDTITANARFASNLVPSTDGARDLGASGLEWKDLYLDGVAYMDAVEADTLKVGDLTDNRLIFAGASGELEDSANLTYDGSTLDIAAAVSIDGDVTLDNDHDVKARSFITYSDATLKTNVKTVTNAMDMIQGLRGVSYDLKAGGKREFGFIAQEVNTVVPEVVSTKNNMMGIDYTRITSLLVEAVKTQQAQIEALKAKLDK